MIAKNQTDVPIQPVKMEGAKDVGIQVLISDVDAAPNFAMRRFTVAPGGHTPHHTHDNEHEVFVLSGEGTLVFDGEEYPLHPGSFALVDPGVIHQFRNAGDENFVFLCVVPIETKHSEK